MTEVKARPLRYKIGAKTLTAEQVQQKIREEYTKGTNVVVGSLELNTKRAEIFRKLTLLTTEALEAHLEGRAKNARQMTDEKFLANINNLIASAKQAVYKAHVAGDPALEDAAVQHLVWLEKRRHFYIHEMQWLVKEYEPSKNKYTDQVQRLLLDQTVVQFKDKISKELDLASTPQQLDDIEVSLVQTQKSLRG